jgi:hypothetical protein
MVFKVGANGKVVKTTTPKKNASASKAGKGKMTPEEVAAMKASYEAALAKNPALRGNPSGHVQGGKRRTKSRKTRKARKTRKVNSADFLKIE